MKEQKARIQKLEIAPGRRILVISDIHGNVPYLEGVLKKANFGPEDELILVMGTDMLLCFEGVETEEQLTLTKTKGIEYVQGYFFSKPLTEDNLLDFLNEQKSNA